MQKLFKLINNVILSLWDTIEDDLPPLIEQLETALGDTDSGKEA